MNLSAPDVFGDLKGQETQAPRGYEAHPVSMRELMENLQTTAEQVNRHRTAVLV